MKVSSNSSSNSKKIGNRNPHNYKKITEEEDEDDEEEEEDEPTGGLSSVKLESKIYNRLKVIVQRKNEQYVKNAITKLVKDYVSREELFERYSPLLYVVTKKDHSVFIKDERERRIVEVILRYRDTGGRSNDTTVELYCDNCESDYCVHTAYATALPELGELKIKKGGGEGDLEGNAFFE